MSSKVPSTDYDVPPSEAVWLNRPSVVDLSGKDIIFTTDKESDFWRLTSYGFIHDSGHALLTELKDGRAIEVTFQALLEGKYDHAGVMLRVDSRNWIKVTVELVDGEPQLAVVVTRDYSDWSIAPVPTWNDGSTPVTVRASRSGDAVTFRARLGDQPWQFVRLAPLSASANILAGPMACSPTRSGLQVRFTKFALGPADLSLHE